MVTGRRRVVWAISPQGPGEAVCLYPGCREAPSLAPGPGSLMEPVNQPSSAPGPPRPRPSRANCPTAFPCRVTQSPVRSPIHIPILLPQVNPSHRPSTESGTLVLLNGPGTLSRKNWIIFVFNAKHACVLFFLFPAKIPVTVKPLVKEALTQHEQQHQGIVLVGR